MKEKILFTKKEENNYRIALEGVSFKTTVWGSNTSMSVFHLEKGSVIPIHKHPHEQTGYLVSGAMKFILDGETYEAGAGDSWNISGNIEHGVEVLEDTVVIEVFSPVREDYLP